MKARSGTAEDLIEVNRWREFWKFPVSADILPDSSVVIERDGIPLCIGYLYFSTTPVTWLEWIVSNPFADRIEAGIAVDKLLEKVGQFAKEEGLILFTTVTHKGLERRLNKAGFTFTETSNLYVK